MQTNLRVVEAPPKPPDGASEKLVPASYAEKSMASLMRLHGELMVEKEKQLDLYRRLMEKEQALAELRMYVDLLEKKVARQSHPSASSAKRSEPWRAW